jgi:hypothetical protein
MYNEAVVQICALCWLFQLRLIMRGTNMKVTRIICFFNLRPYLVNPPHSSFTNQTPDHSNFSLSVLPTKQKCSDSQQDSSWVMKLLKGGLSCCNYSSADSCVDWNIKKRTLVVSRNLSYDSVFKCTFLELLDRHRTM